MKTNSSSVKWVVEIYPYESDYPSVKDGLSIGNITPAIIGSKSIQASSLENISAKVFSNSSGSVSPQILNTLGVKQVTINRSKQSPSAPCSIAVTGPLSPVFVSGNWVIVSSAQATNQANLQTVVRFIGQIDSISVNYSSSSEGILQTNSNITIREWSSILQSQIMFDYTSAQRLLVGDNAGVVMAKGLMNSLSGEANPAEELKKLEDVLKKAYNPFETAHIVLKLLGLLSANDALQKTKEVSNSFNKMALTPPKIPQAVLSRLGINASMSSSTDWNGGFCNVVTGVKPPSSMSDGNWMGVLGSGNAPSLDTYKTEVTKNFKNRLNKNRSQNVLTGLSSRFDAWSLLNQYCDSTFNEVFTDMYWKNKAELCE